MNLINFRNSNSGLFRPHFRHLHKTVEISTTASGRPRFQIRFEEVADRRNRLQNRTTLLSLLVRKLIVYMHCHMSTVFRHKCALTAQVNFSGPWENSSPCKLLLNQNIT